MTDIESLCFEPRFGLLICKAHGTGVHPEPSAIERHLRGKLHHCKRKKLKQAVATLSELPLKSRAALLNAHPATKAQPIRAIPHLNIYNGWSCRLCHGEHLTTSREVRDRHVSRAHCVRPSSHQDAAPLWDICTMQTFFSMTGDVRYFRVVSAQDHATPDSLNTIDESQSCSRHQYNDRSKEGQRAKHFLDFQQSQRKEHDAIAAAAANVNPDPTQKSFDEELWMKRLGISRYIAGLQKDEMAEQNIPSSSSTRNSRRIS